MATMLRLEKYGRINFSLGRWVPMDPKTPKSIKVHARGPGELVRTFFRSLTLSQESLFQRSSLHLPKKVLNQKIWISLAAISYLSAPVFPISLPHHCCTAQHCQAMRGVYWCKKNVILIQIILVLSYPMKKLGHSCCISVPIQCMSFQWLIPLKFLPNCGIVVACFACNSILSPFTTRLLFFCNNLARFYSVDTAL